MSKCAILVNLGVLVAAVAHLGAAPRAITVSQPPASTEAYDFVDLEIQVDGADAANPFTDADVRGSFEKSEGRRWKWMASAIRPMAAFFGSASCPPTPEITIIPSLTARARLKRRRRAPFTRLPAIAAAPSGWIRSILGISSGKVRANIISSTARRLSGWSAGGKTGSSTTSSTGCSSLKINRHARAAGRRRGYLLGRAGHDGR